MGTTVLVKQPDQPTRTAKITKLFTFEGTKRVEVQEVIAGDIVLIAGITDVSIGDTIVTDEATPARTAITVDEPTISLQLLVNNSPFAGREGKFVTSRQLRERLERELQINVGLRISFDDDAMTLFGRGELHIAVLLEIMRREGYEMQVSQPRVIIKEENGNKTEPWEEVIIDVPTEYSGAVIEKLNRRRGMMMNMIQEGINSRIVFEMPTRGLMGYRGQFVIDTRGEGILSSRVTGFKPMAGSIDKRDVGSMISRETGKTTAFALWGLQERGLLYVEPGTEVYEGMVVGNTSKGDEMLVSPTKGKALSNVRASGTDEAISLKPAYVLSIERGLETMVDDEYLEITPTSVRLRKRHLTESDRARAGRKG
jgi:GTP-binding protein